MFTSNKTNMEIQLTKMSILDIYIAHKHLFLLDHVIYLNW